MQRKLIHARPVRSYLHCCCCADRVEDWIQKNAANGLLFHNNADGSPYWGEGLVYEIPEEMVDRITSGAQVI